MGRHLTFTSGNSHLLLPATHTHNVSTDAQEICIAQQTFGQCRVEEKAWALHSDR